ncbi:DUF1972 domain-containing protein [Vibrio tapetis subsp. quintayensis]|uniref:DUF1972 domain-containing protein n=1 Tax=Vibrio tapetis TaxID=52443 RepID=UPI0025B3C7FC|nr:DUF1972 domain-containing protein [Vibrio tapetis]MDN3679469.1 DUF1972 domain-containing protein [Vibrio tapetis subsp. quintayensis]
MRKVVVIGTVGIPACYGGFESLVENLTLNKNHGTKYSVFCSGKSYTDRLDEHNTAKLYYLPLKANGIQSIPYDILSMMKTWVIKPDVVLILGVSGCVFLPIFKFFSKSKIVTNIDGLEWKREKWGRWVKRFLKFSESIAVKHSDVIVTDNQAITDYVFDEYGVKSETIAYGGDHAIPKNSAHYEAKKGNYALGLCRIEPENNVEMILEAYSRTTKHLKFVGNWAASEFGRKLKRTYSKYTNIELLDPIYDIEELYRLRSDCSLYLHGHSAGGTNPSLVEMMHFGVPILAFDCNFNRYSTEEKACYFKSSVDLAKLLNADSNTKELKSNGKAMREVAISRYTWEIIAHKYEGTYL